MNNCEKTAKLLKLASENPELPIIFEVDNEVVPNDEYGWYLGSMSRCRVNAELEKYLNKIADENFKTAIIVSISPYSE